MELLQTALTNSKNQSASLHADFTGKFEAMEIGNLDMIECMDKCQAPAKDDDEIPPEYSVDVPSVDTLQLKSKTNDPDRIRREMVAIEQLLRLGDSSPGVLPAEARKTAETEYDALQKQLKQLSIKQDKTKASTIAWTDDSEDELAKHRNAVVLFPFKARTAEELDVEEGEKLNFEGHGESDDWVLVRNSKGKRGYVPSSYVQIS